MKRLVLLLAIIAVFSTTYAQSQGSPPPSSWTTLVAAVSTNPLNDLSVPSGIEEPSNLTSFTTGLMMRNEDAFFIAGENCGPQPYLGSAWRDIDIDDLGSGPRTTVLLSNQYFACFLLDEIVNTIRGEWTATTRIYLSGGTDATTILRIRIVRWWAESYLGFGGPVEDAVCAFDTTISGVPITDVTVVSTGCTAGAWSFDGANVNNGALVVKYAISSTTETVQMILDGGALPEVSYVAPAGFTSSASDCGWYNPMACVVETPQVLMYIAGLFWAFLVAILSIFVWLITILITLTASLYDLVLYIGTVGGDAPMEISIILTGFVVVSLFTIIAWVIGIIRGVRA